ncbi:MAG: SGNH/GDSL hydrolase family protein [Ruminococcaceae bacterium]|nr:SGNH/GDSL hydrolase family protein [Oscillospiraceae bacterium]
MFRQYVSNIPIGTGNNCILEAGKPTRLKARAYLRPTVCGEFTWRFYFSNTVDSTFNPRGEVAWRNKPGGCWRILSATVSTAPDRGCDKASEVLRAASPVTNTENVTFDGKGEKNVSPDERFWSDPVTFSVDEGSYLVWEWEIEGDGIPFTPDSQVPVFCDWGDGWRYGTDCPFPALFGCERTVKKRIAFLGDSITQGCGTGINEYGMWVAKIARALSDDYAVWNLGLGFGRGSDAASDGAWLHKAKQCDIAVLTYGVNDLESGSYGRGRGDTAVEFLETEETLIRLLTEAGVEVILNTVPPFPLDKMKTEQWRIVNRAIPRLAAKHNLRLFDIEKVFDASPDLGGLCQYGDHPDGRGGTAAADAFLKFFNGDPF